MLCNRKEEKFDEYIFLSGVIFITRGVCESTSVLKFGICMLRGGSMQCIRVFPLPVCSVGACCLLRSLHANVLASLWSLPAITLQDCVDLVLLLQRDVALSFSFSSFNCIQVHVPHDSVQFIEFIEFDHRPTDP